MNDVRVYQFLNEGLARVYYNGDLALWCKVKIRKAKACAVTEKMMQSGDVAWRPVGNQMYRSSRISDEVMEATKQEYPELALALKDRSKKT